MECSRKKYKRFGNDMENVPSCFKPRPPSSQETVKSSDAREMHFKCPAYQSDSFKVFEFLKDTNHLCDVDVVVENEVFRCHKIILAAASPYFRAMFTSGLMESKMDKVNLQGVDSHSVSVLINFAYSGEILIKEMTICQILPVATMFQMNYVIEACSKFLEKQLAAVNCIGITEYALQHGCTSLHNAGQAFIYQHFSQVCMEEEFLTLSESKLINLVKSDELNVPCETIVYDAVMRWLKYDEVIRMPKIKHILSLVRLHFVPPQFLQQQISSCNVLKEAPQCREYIVKVFQELSIHKKPSIEPRTPQNPPVVYTAGGYLSKSLNNLELYSPHDMEWYFLTPLPKPRSGLGGAFILGKFHVIGGRNNNADGNQDSDAVDCYDPVTNSWHSCSPMTVPRHRVGVGVIDQMLYAVGGSNGKIYHKSVERYSCVEDCWTFMESMKTARIGVCVAVVNRLMYAIGGFDGADRLSSVEKYHPEKNEWEYVTSMAIKRSGAGAVAIDQYIYVVGGFDGNVQLETVERYNTETNQWDFIAPMKIKRSALSVDVVNGLIFAFGGYDGTEFLSSVEVYDPEKNEWMEAPSMSCGRSGHASAVYTTPCVLHTL